MVPNLARSWRPKQTGRLRGEGLEQALACLDARSRRIIEARWLREKDTATLHDLADELGVSAERIRQIEAKPCKKCGSAMVPSRIISCRKLLKRAPLAKQARAFLPYHSRNFLSHVFPLAPAAQDLSDARANPMLASVALRPLFRRHGFSWISAWISCFILSPRRDKLTDAVAPYFFREIQR